MGYGQRQWSLSSLLAFVLLLSTMSRVTRGALPEFSNCQNAHQNIEESGCIPPTCLGWWLQGMTAGVRERDADMVFLGMMDGAGKRQVCRWNTGLLLPAISPAHSIMQRLRRTYVGVCVCVCVRAHVHTHAFVWFLLFCFVEKGSHYVVQMSLKLMTLLPRLWSVRMMGEL